MSEWYVDSIQHTNLKKRVISEHQESLLGVAQIIRLFFKKNITSRNRKLLRILGRVDIIFGQCVLSKTQDGKAHLAAAAGRPSKRCNAVHRAFCQEPFGNGRNGHMALLQVAYSAAVKIRCGAP